MKPDAPCQLCKVRAPQPAGRPLVVYCYRPGCPGWRRPGWKR